MELPVRRNRHQADDLALLDRHVNRPGRPDSQVVLDRPPISRVPELVEKSDRVGGIGGRGGAHRNRLGIPRPSPVRHGMTSASNGPPVAVEAGYHTL